MFNRDERAYSGPGAARVTCIGRVEVKDMVGEVVRQSTPQGGWTNLAITDGQAIVFKAEINTGNLPVEAGTFNNIYMLRKGIRESQRQVRMRGDELVDTNGGRPLTDNGWNYLPVFSIPGVENNALLPPLVGFNDVPLLTSDGRPVVNNGNTVFDYSVINNLQNFASPNAVQRALQNGRVFGKQ